MATSPLSQHPVGRILRVLRLGHSRRQAARAALLGIERSYLSRLERESDRRLPRPALLRAWVQWCPVAALPANRLVADLRELSARSPADVADGPAGRVDADWLLATRLAAGVAPPEGLRWAQVTGTALRFPAAEAFAPDHLPALLWLALRSLRTHLGSSDPTVMSSDLAALMEQVSAWPRVSAAPSRAAGGDDPAWNALQALWPRLPAAARLGLLAAAWAWAESR